MVDYNECLGTYVSTQVEKNLSDKPTKEEAVNVVKAAFKTSQSVFDSFKTEYKRFKFYEMKGLFHMPLEYAIGDKYVKNGRIIQRRYVNMIFKQNTYL